MGNYINKGNDGFASLCNSKFVDKSMLIAEVNSVMMTERRPVASASHPITGGPTRKPKKLMLETMVMAMLALMVPSFPAML